LEITWDDFKRDCMLVITRGFAASDGRIALAPFVDMINNHCDLNVQHPENYQSMEWDDEKRVVTSRVSMGGNVGEEIFSCYVLTQQPRMVLWQHGYAPDRRKDQSVVLDNFSLNPSDPLVQQKDKLIQELVTKGRDPWDLCIVDSGIPMDTTLTAALIVVEQDQDYLSIDKFRSLFEPLPDGRLPAIMRAEPALDYIIKLIKDKISIISNKHPRAELVSLVNNESIPFSLRQIHKLQLSELDICTKLLKTDISRWHLYPSLRRVKVPRNNGRQKGDTTL